MSRRPRWREVALFDAHGGPHLSGADFAVVIVDDIDHATHPPRHIGTAYQRKQAGDRSD